jgi:ketosteroid isomerase-like protein
MRTRSLIPAALLLCGCALRHRPVAPEPARGPARDSLFAVDQSRRDSAAALGAQTGLLSLFAANVAYLRAGAPTVYGRDAARIVLNAGPTAQNAAVSWEPLGGGISDDLNSGYTFGLTARASGVPATIRTERYIAYWQRARGTPWRIVAYAEVGGPPIEVAALTSAQTTPPVVSLPRELAQARAAVWAADSMFSDLSYRMGTAYAFSNTVAERGVLFGTPELVIGPDAVREEYAARPATSSMTWKPVHAGISGSRDLGYTIGESVSTGVGPSGAAVQHFGKYLTVWKRQKDARWRWVVDGGSVSPARAAEK